MRVARHADVAFISASVHDTAFANATTALTTDNGSNDIACPLTLERLDSYVFWNSGTSADVTSQAQYQANQNNPTGAYYIVVNTISWCGGLTGAVGGCGWRSGSSPEPFLVTRPLAVSAQRGIVLAHEFGHTVGLAHDTLGNQIMDPDVLTANDNKVKVCSVCVAFKHDFTNNCGGNVPVICSPDADVPDCIFPQSALAPSRADVAPLGASAQSLASTSTSTGPVPSIEEAVQQVFLDRVPTDLDRYYSAEDGDYLAEILFDKSRAEFHRTAATMLGLISDGNDAHTSVLVAYADTVGADAAAAMMALGYLVARHHNEDALQALLDWFDSGDIKSATNAALGLTLSGDPRGYDRLVARSSEVSDPSAQYTLLAQAAENSRVHRLGLAGHYAAEPMTTQTFSVTDEPVDSVGAEPVNWRVDD